MPLYPHFIPLVFRILEKIRFRDLKVGKPRHIRKVVLFRENHVKSRKFSHFEKTTPFWEN